MSTQSPSFSPETVAHIAELANIPVSSQEQQDFAQAFSDTLVEIEHILQVDVTDTPATHHTTGLKNVWREDVVDTERMIPQSAALAQAAHSFNDFILVDRVIEESA